MKKICGLKLTHDAAVAGIEGSKLLFCVEVEKLNNNPRYSTMPDFATISKILVDHDFDPDIFVVDGWKHGKIDRTMDTTSGWLLTTSMMAMFPSSTIAGSSGKACTLWAAQLRM
jgi:predicted NodU family carbamoyl transferase